MITALRSLAYMAVFYTGSAFYVTLGMPLALILPRTTKPVAASWGLFHRRCAHWLLGQKVVVDGPLPQGDYLYVIKHESMFETIDMLCLFRYPVVAAKQELFSIPLWGGIARRYGLIPVERSAGAKALRTLREGAAAARAEGRAVCIFPEGTRVPHGQCPPLQSGFAGLYGLLKLPVVPIAIDSGRLSPRGKFLKRAGAITYKVGEVIPAGLDRREAEARTHAAINALNR